jgi:hypothetical protein
MVHALVTIATTAEAEPSKTAFYILGGALAVWAVVLSAIGLTQPDFPRQAGQSRAVMAISAVLVVGALVASVATA